MRACVFINDVNSTASATSFRAAVKHCHAQTCLCEMQTCSRKSHGSKCSPTVQMPICAAPSCRGELLEGYEQGTFQRLHYVGQPMGRRERRSPRQLGCVDELLMSLSFTKSERNFRSGSGEHGGGEKWSTGDGTVCSGYILRQRQ